MVFEGKLSHAYIISSASETARNDAARDLAAAMLCVRGDGEKRPCGECRHCRKVMGGIHPDVFTVERQKDDRGKLRREILVDQVRYMVADAPVLPNEAAKKVYIVKDADTMNAAAQNAFLKLLEEPPDHACFILCAANVGAFLDTVRSRCTELSIHAPVPEPDGRDMALAREYLRLAVSGDRAGTLKFCAANEGMDKDEAMMFALAAERILGDALCSRETIGGASRAKLMEMMENIGTVQRYLTSNVSVKHVFGMLAAV